MTSEHQPVLLDEAIEGLAIRPDGIYLDLTFGRGGHSQEILKRLGPEGRLMAMDKDTVAVEKGKTGPFCDPRFSIRHGSFVELEQTVDDVGWHSRVDGILLDLGVSSPQLDNPERGFSFMREGPLDMRMNREQSMDASTWINQTDIDDMTKVFREYGEERYARRIATAIEKERTQSPITTTKALAALIARVVPRHEKGKHPATRCFQAIRIAVNNELEELKQCLEQCLKVLSVGGRLVVISFHSLEDRIVKRFFNEKAKGDNYPRDLPILDEKIKRQLKLIGSLIRPSEGEVTRNVRARSARCRIAEKRG